MESLFGIPGFTFCFFITQFSLVSLGRRIQEVWSLWPGMWPLFPVVSSPPALPGIKERGSEKQLAKSLLYFNYVHTVGLGTFSHKVNWAEPAPKVSWFIVFFFLCSRGGEKTLAAVVESNPQALLTLFVFIVCCLQPKRHNQFPQNTKQFAFSVYFYQQTCKSSRRRKKYIQPLVMSHFPCFLSPPRVTWVKAMGSCAASTSNCSSPKWSSTSKWVVLAYKTQRQSPSSLIIFVSDSPFSASVSPRGGGPAS